MMKEMYLKLAEKHGTPLLVIDHQKIKENYRAFIKNLIGFKCYYAIKANPIQEIINTLYEEGASFDAASYSEFMQVIEAIKDLDEKEQTNFIEERLIFSNTIKDRQTLKKIRQYKPLMTFDNVEELKKIKEYCDTAKLLLRLKVPDSGSLVELGSKFGAEISDADKLMSAAKTMGLDIKGISFHVGSQCLNFDNYANSFEIAADVIYNSGKWKEQIEIVDIGGGFPANYYQHNPDFEKLAEIINFDCQRLFANNIKFIAEPGRFLVANAGVLITEIIGKSKREGKMYYHINDGIYGSFANVLHDHFLPDFVPFKKGHEEVCAVVGPTCDSFDKISMSTVLPVDLNIGDLLLTHNIGAYSISTTTRFNGFEPPKVVNINN